MRKHAIGRKRPQTRVDGKNNGPPNRRTAGGFGRNAADKQFLRVLVAGNHILLWDGHLRFERASVHDQRARRDRHHLFARSRIHEERARKRRTITNAKDWYF